MMIKKILSKLPKKFLAGAAVTVVALVAMGSIGGALLGGDRPVKQYQGPGTPGFDHVTFNSFTNVPNIGDERDFFNGKIAGAPDGFYDPMNGVRGGDEVLMRVYVHNGADPKHNASGKGIARNTKVRVALPTGRDQKQVARAFVSADNAQPQIIEDTLTMNGKYPVELKYVPGSATIKSNFIDQAISDNVVKDGVLIGDNNVNGDMKGCFEYIALVTFKVKVVAPSYSLEKKVSQHGKDSYSKSITAKPGEKVDYVLAFKNVGSTDLKNVVLGDRLPNKVTYEQNSTHWISGHTGNKWVKAESNNITTGGVNIGAYAPNGAAYLRFTAQLPDEDELECGINKLVNKGFAKPEDHGTIEDEADVIIKKECQPDKPVFACDALTASKVGSGNRTYRFNTEYTARNGAEFKRFVYDFGDGSDELVTDQDSVEHTYEPGEYTAQVTVVFDVNGEEKTATGQQCMVNIFVGKKPKDNCPIPGKEHLPKDSPECVEQPVPSELPKTGAGDIAAIFAATTVAGMIAYRLILARRFN